MKENKRKKKLKGRPGHRFGQRMAISVPVLQERRGRLPHTLLPHADSRRHTDVLHGAGPRPDADHRRPRRLQDRPAVQGHRLRGRRHVLLDERLLHRHPRLGDLLLFYVHAQR